jgi:hypothetical protein
MNIKKLFFITSILVLLSTADSFAQLTKIWEIKHFDGTISSLSPKGKLAHAGAYLVDLNDGIILETKYLPETYILTHTGKRYFISNYQTKTLKVFDRFTNEFIQDLNYHQVMDKTITAPDDSTVFVANKQVLEFWNIYTNELKDTFKLPDLEVGNYYSYVLNELPSFSYDGRYFAYRVSVYSTNGKPGIRYTIFMVYDRKAKEIVFKENMSLDRYLFVYSFMHTTNQLAYGEVVKLESDDKPYSYIRIFDLEQRKIVRNVRVGEEKNGVANMTVRSDDKFILYLPFNSGNTVYFYNYLQNNISNFTIKESDYLIVGTPLFADEKILVTNAMCGYSLNWSTVGVKNLNENDNLSTIFPNPTTNTINLNIEPNYYNGNWQLTDLTGQILLKGEISNNENFQIDISNLPTATYFLRISNGKEFKVEKVVKW